MRRGSPLLGLCIATALGCATGLVHPTVEDASWASARWPQTTLEELERARAVYVSKCSGCHHLHRPQEYSADRWPSLIAEMRGEAKIDHQEEELIVKYLVATSARLRSSTLKEPANVEKENPRY